MSYFKSFEQFMNEASEIDPDLEDIRFFRGSVQQFNDFWERKIKGSINPHGKVKYKYPYERTEDDNSLPYQDFVNGKSLKTSYTKANRKKGKNG